MERKVKVCITIDREVLETAKEHITYLSRYIETCLRRANAKHKKENVYEVIDKYKPQETIPESEETQEFYANLED